MTEQAGKEDRAVRCRTEQCGQIDGDVSLLVCRCPRRSLCGRFL